MTASSFLRKQTCRGNLTAQRESWPVFSLRDPRSRRPSLVTSAHYKTSTNNLLFFRLFQKGPVLWPLHGHNFEILFWGGGACSALGLTFIGPPLFTLRGSAIPRRQTCGRRRVNKTDSPSFTHLKAAQGTPRPTIGHPFSRYLQPVLQKDDLADISTLGL